MTFLPLLFHLHFFTFTFLTFAFLTFHIFFSLSYMQVSAESNDTFLEDESKNVDLNSLDSSWTHGCGPGGGDTSARNVGKLIVTQNKEDLNSFFENPNAIVAESVRLSEYVCLCLELDS